MSIRRIKFKLHFSNYFRKYILVLYIIYLF